MTQADRWGYAIAIVLLDLVVFVVPLTGILAAYLILVRPPWFRRWIAELYGTG